VKALVFGLLFFPILGRAGELNCRAPFDDSSYYHLTASLDEDARILGGVDFAYFTNDGFELHAEMEPVEQRVEPEKSLFLKARGDFMSIEAEAELSPEGTKYEGALKVSFSLDGAPDLEVLMSCDLVRFNSRPHKQGPKLLGFAR